MPVAADGPVDGLPVGPLLGVADVEALAAVGGRFVCYDCGASFGFAVAVNCHTMHAPPRLAEEVAAADVADKEWRRLARASGVNALAGPSAIVVRQGPRGRCRVNKVRPWTRCLRSWTLVLFLLW